MERRMGLSTDVIRFLTLRVETLESEPSVMMRKQDRDERGDRGGFRGGDRGGFRGGDRGGFRGGAEGGSTFRSRPPREGDSRPPRDGDRGPRPPRPAFNKTEQEG
jgi:small subunit ribosomal protein S6